MIKWIKRIISDFILENLEVKITNIVKQELQAEHNEMQAKALEKTLLYLSNHIKREVYPVYRDSFNTLSDSDKSNIASLNLIFTELIHICTRHATPKLNDKFNQEEFIDKVIDRINRKQVK